jgi:hypothetical protein
VRVGLEPSAQERAHEAEDLGGVAVDVAGVDRSVVLVDEDDDLLSVAPVKVGGEVGEGLLVDLASRGAVDDRPIVPGFPLAEEVALEQGSVRVEEDRDLPPERRPAMLEALALGVLRS